MSGTEEFPGKIVLIVTPQERAGVDFNGCRWEIDVDVHPDYATDDFNDPISLQEEDREGDPITLYPENAEALGHALLRAAEIRRAAVALHAARNGAKP